MAPGFCTKLTEACPTLPSWLLFSAYPAEPIATTLVCCMRNSDGILVLDEKSARRLYMPRSTFHEAVESLDQPFDIDNP